MASSNSFSKRLVDGVPAFNQLVILEPQHGEPTMSV
jgi:hypothetical protein